jgi:hypothetical protein
MDNSWLGSAGGLAVTAGAAREKLSPEGEMVFILKEGFTANDQPEWALWSSQT